MMKKNKHAVIGICGYMGSGKSTVAEILSRKGARVIDVDSVAKQLMNRDERIRQSIATAFGDDICIEESINFSLLGQRAYASLETLKQLNRLVHPLLLHELSLLRNTSYGQPCVFDAALIAHWHIENWFDALVWVEAPAHIRLNRIAEKSALSREVLAKRMDLQHALFDKPREARWIEVNNAGTIEQLEQRLSAGDFGSAQKMFHS